MTSNEQLQEWLKGNSIHNDDVWIDIVDSSGNVLRRECGKGGECCPDFSCCRPELKWEDDQRRIFVENESLRSGMLMMSLSALLDSESVYIVGFEEA